MNNGADSADPAEAVDPSEPDSPTDPAHATPRPSAERGPVRPTGPGPIGGELSSFVWGLASRARIPTLVRHYDSTTVMGLFALVNGVVSIAIMSTIALATDAAFIFPSLGPTAFVFFYTPTADPASPRNAFCGHLIGALAGYLALVLFGLTDAGTALTEGVTLARVGSAALSLGLTSGVMVWARVPHPPAGATTLIISLGILTTPRQLVILMAAVVLLSVQAWCFNHLAGIDYPAWRSRT